MQMERYMNVTGAAVHNYSERHIKKSVMWFPFQLQLAGQQKTVHQIRRYAKQGYNIMH